MRIAFLFLFLFFSCYALASNGMFKTNGGNKIQKIIIQYLEENSKSLMQRGGLENVVVAPCMFQGATQAIRVCSQYAEPQHNGGVLIYSIQEETYAHLLVKILPSVKRVLVIEKGASQLARILNDMGIITTSITDGNMRELVKAMDLPGRFDAVVLGVHHGIIKSDLKSYLNFLAKQRLIVFTADPTDISLGATVAVAPSQDEILDSFTGILQYYKLTGLLKSTPSICAGSVRINKRAARALNLDVLPKQMAAFKEKLASACI